MAEDKPELGAVLIYSRLLDTEVWLIKNAATYRGMLEDGDIGDRAVFTFKEAERLKGKDEKELKAIIAIKKAFGPNARVQQ